MSRIFKDRLSMGVTPVADTFIDTYMAAANGEYVKVYLYILRHQNKEDLSLEQIADALNHTEADVKRAINYWQKAGVLEQVQESPGRKYIDRTKPYQLVYGHRSNSSCFQRNCRSPGTVPYLFSRTGKPFE